jgi:hypothetical protein
MVKRPTGSDGEPSSPNCGVSAGVKARHLFLKNVCAELGSGVFLYLLLTLSRFAKRQVVAKLILQQWPHAMKHQARAAAPHERIAIVQINRLHSI